MYVYRNLWNDTTNQVTSLWPAQSFEYAEYSGYAPYDTYRVEELSTDASFITEKILMGIITPTYSFGNSNRKTIHKLKILTDEQPPVSTTPFSSAIGTRNTWQDDNSYASIALAKRQHTLGSRGGSVGDSFTNVRQIPLATAVSENPQWTTYNWGTMRQAQFLITIPYFKPFRLLGLEVTISENSH